MQSRLTHKLVLPSGVPCEIRQILPADFMDYPGGVPISFFETKSVQTMAEKVLGVAPQNKSTDNEKILSAIEAILNAGVVSYNDDKFNAHEFVQTDWRKNAVDMLQMQAEVLKLSLVFFADFKLKTMDNEFLSSCDVMAKRYGMTPAQILFSSINHTPLDAWIINKAVCVPSYNEDIKNKQKGLIVL